VAKLSKYRAFVNEYFKLHMNGTQAYRNIYGQQNDNAAAACASQLLRNPKVVGLVEKRLIEMQMSADEALALLADEARGDIAEFMDINSMGFSLKLLDDEGNKKNTRLIHRIKQKTTIFIAKKESDEDREVHEIEIELYDAQAAKDKILRVAGKYKNNVDITSGGEPIKHIFEVVYKDKP
jgi:hypothetical protein